MLRSLVAMSFTVVLFSVGFGQPATAAQEKVLVKANTEFSMQLTTIVDSEKSVVGDDVKFVLMEDVNGDGVKFLKGTEVLGRVVNVEKLSTKGDAAKVCVMFDFLKNGQDFVAMVATITSLDPNVEAIKLNPSPTYSGGTTLLLKGKDIQLDKGRVFKVKLIKDMTAQ